MSVFNGIIQKTCKKKYLVHKEFPTTRTEIPLNTTTYVSSVTDGPTVFSFHNGLTINQGALFTPSTRCKGMCLVVKNKLIVNGRISMTARGASAVGENLAIDYRAGEILIEPSNLNDYEWTVGSIGGTGGARVGGYSGTWWNSGGVTGSAGINGACGGGGSGACSIYNCTGYSGYGGRGTSYSGGAGGGGVSLHQSNQTGGTGSSTGGLGGIGRATWNGTNGRGGGGGAGNGGGNGTPANTTNTAVAGTPYGGPGGNASSYACNGASSSGGAGNNGGINMHYPSDKNGWGNSGTAGLLILYVLGNLYIHENGIIESNGSDSGGWTMVGGGASGGGSINIFHKNNFINNGTIRANGGIGYYYAPHGIKGGNGGAGTITVTKI